jgi:tetratricopeptide (TPR) repeat protein
MAETLRAMGRLQEALDAYDSAIAEHPENVFAKTGKAETLRAMGRLQEALDAYDSAIAEHPENVVTKNGRAETLRAMGRLQEALDAYDSAIAEHPGDVVTKNGKAETLRAMGRLQEALDAYDSAIAEHPENVFAKNGRSCVLVALGRYDKALMQLPASNPSTLQDWIGYHIRGMILLRTNRVEEAIRIFEHGVRENPIPSSREYFQNGLAVACLRRRDFVKAGKVLEGVKAPLLQPQANVLRLHAYGVLGNESRAAAAYEGLRDKPWTIPDELFAELQRRYMLKEEPHHDDEWVSDQEIDMLFSNSGQQMLSSALLA